MLIQSFLEQSSKHSPTKKAVWYKNRWMTYKEIDTYANQVGQFLVQRGLERGQRVALLLENSFAFIIIYFGILKAGGVVVGLNTEIMDEEIEYFLSHSDARLLFISQERFCSVEQTRAKLPVPTTVVVDNLSPFASEELNNNDDSIIPFYRVLKEYPSCSPIVRLIDIDLAEIIYTSGSTGVPKGVMLSHLNLVSNMHSITEYLQLSSKDRIMVVLPFTYIYGKSLLLTHFLIGGSLVIYNQFVYFNGLLETMQINKVTGFAGVPATFSLLPKKSVLSDYTFEYLRYVTLAGGYMPPSLKREVKDAFYPAVLYVMYGATEAGPRLTYLQPSDLNRKPDSIGIPVPNVDLFIVDKNGHQLPFGVEGEIAARGSNIMQGYWKDPEGTQQVLKQGLYFTGDIGKQDSEGYFYIIDRKKDIIKVKGYKVSAREVEEKILEIHEVFETAVIGVKDPVLGEAVKAFVVLRAGGNITSQTVLGYLKPRLSRFKLPKYIEFRDYIPKNQSGKILKTALPTD
jgi:acyl-CoA synthetase (AMP-forming)/AMP-acid ligase II